MRYIDPYNQDHYIAKHYCAFLDRVFRMRVFNYASERRIVNRFLAIRSLDDLKVLCNQISQCLTSKLGYNELFIA